MKVKLSNHERAAIEKRITAIEKELKALEGGHLSRASHARQWERLLDEMAALKEKVDE